MKMTFCTFPWPSGRAPAESVGNPVFQAVNSSAKTKTPNHIFLFMRTPSEMKNDRRKRKTGKLGSFKPLQSDPPSEARDLARQRVIAFHPPPLYQRWIPSFRLNLNNHLLISCYPPLKVASMLADGVKPLDALKEWRRWSMRAFSPPETFLRRGKTR